MAGVVGQNPEDVNRMLSRLPLERRVISELFMKMTYLHYQPTEGERVALSQCNASVNRLGGLYMAIGGCSVWALGRAYPRFGGFPYWFTFISSCMAGFYVGGQAAAPQCVHCLAAGNSSVASETRSIVRRIDPSSKYASMAGDIPPEQVAPPLWTRERLEYAQAQLRAQGLTGAQLIPPFPLDPSQGSLDQGGSQGWEGSSGDLREGKGGVQETVIPERFYSPPAAAEQLPSDSFQEGEDPWEAKQKQQQKSKRGWFG